MLTLLSKHINRVRNISLRLVSKNRNITLVSKEKANAKVYKYFSYSGTTKENIAEAIKQFNSLEVEQCEMSVSSIRLEGKHNLEKFNMRITDKNILLIIGTDRNNTLENKLLDVYIE